MIDGSKVAFTIELTTPACPLKDQIEAEVRQALLPLGVGRPVDRAGRPPSGARSRARPSSSSPASRT